MFDRFDGLVIGFIVGFSVAVAFMYIGMKASGWLP